MEEKQKENLINDLFGANGVWVNALNKADEEYYKEHGYHVWEGRISICTEDENGKLTELV